MQLVQATAAVLMVLAIFIGAMAWEIRNALKETVIFQKEILAELVYAKLRSGTDSNPAPDKPPSARAASKH